MAYVITEPCVGTCDTSCVKVCPVDCIHGPIKQGEIDRIHKLPEAQQKAKFKGLQLYIDPDTCIDCGACEPECPVDAIFEADAVPSKWAHYTDKNADFFIQKKNEELLKKR